MKKQAIRVCAVLLLIFAMTFAIVCETSANGGENHADGLGELISDSYVYAVGQAEGDAYIPVDFAVVATGMEWTFNPNRMIFDKVVDCVQVLPDGSPRSL